MAAPQPIRPVGATDHVDTLPAPQPLTSSERNALIGLQARANEYARIVNEAEREIVAEIEARLGVVLGATHTVDPQTWMVTAMPAPMVETP